MGNVLAINESVIVLLMFIVVVFGVLVYFVYKLIIDRLRRKCPNCSNLYRKSDIDWTIIHSQSGLSTSSSISLVTSRTDYIDVEKTCSNCGEKRKYKTTVKLGLVEQSYKYGRNEIIDARTRGALMKK